MLLDRYRELLTAYVDGELTARQRRHVARLLRRSPEARQLLQQLQRRCSLHFAICLSPHLPVDLTGEVLRTIVERRLTPGAAPGPPGFASSTFWDRPPGRLGSRRRRTRLAGPRLLSLLRRFPDAVRSSPTSPSNEPDTLSSPNVPEKTPSKVGRQGADSLVTEIHRPSRPNLISPRWPRPPKSSKGRPAIRQSRAGSASASSEG